MNMQRHGSCEASACSPTSENQESVTVSVTEVLEKRNAVHAAKHPGVTPPLDPTLRALVLTCADHRVDPAHVLGLELNEAVVFRNIGGRVTRDFLTELACIVTVATLENLGSGFELIIMQHTDCGIARLGGIEHRELLAAYFGIDPDEVAGHFVTDPFSAARFDVEQLRNNPFIPRSLQISGAVYDVSNGGVTVVGPAAIGDNQ
jgi:carbonic anhydrase